MDASLRRQKIAEKLRFSVRPVTGATLSKEMGVSRQIIVADIAILRSAGEHIFATPEGYVLSPASTEKPTRIIAAQHLGDVALEDELATIVALGGTVVDVSIEHKIYGEFKAMLLIHDRQGVDNFIHALKDSGMSPMSLLTGGVHLHTILADDEQTLNQIEEALLKKGYLVDESFSRPLP